MNFARIADVNATDRGAIASNIFVAAVELACPFGAEGDAEIHFSGLAAGFFLIVALLFIWSAVVQAPEVSGRTL